MRIENSSPESQIAIKEDGRAQTPDQAKNDDIN